MRVRVGVGVGVGVSVGVGAEGAGGRAQQEGEAEQEGGRVRRRHSTRGILHTSLTHLILEQERGVGVEGINQFRAALSEQLPLHGRGPLEESSGLQREGVDSHAVPDLPFQLPCELDQAICHTGVFVAVQPPSGL